MAVDVDGRNQIQKDDGIRRPSTKLYPRAHLRKLSTGPAVSIYGKDIFGEATCSAWSGQNDASHFAHLKWQIRTAYSNSLSQQSPGVFWVSRSLQNASKLFPGSFRSRTLNVAGATSTRVFRQVLSTNRSSVKWHQNVQTAQKSAFRNISSDAHTKKGNKFYRVCAIAPTYICTHQTSPSPTYFVCMKPTPSYRDAEFSWCNLLQPRQPQNKTATDRHDCREILKTLQRSGSGNRKPLTL